MQAAIEGDYVQVRIVALCGLLLLRHTNESLQYSLVNNRTVFSSMLLLLQTVLHNT